jgi:magnesium-transporting ATPase (P-type)
MIMGCIYFLIILVIYIILGAISIEYCRNQDSIWPVCKDKILTLREESWKKIKARELVVGDKIRLESTGPSNLMVIPADLKIDYMPSTMMIVVEEALIGYSVTKDKKGPISVKLSNGHTKPYEEDVLYAGTYATIIGPEYIECHVIAVGNNTVAHSIMYDYFKFEETTMP